MRSQLSVITVVAGAALALFTNLAHADIVITQGPGSNVGTDNVVFNPCSAEIVGPATTVTGCLNSSTATVVNFTGIENLVANGGQARIEAQDGAYSSLTIDLDGGLTFTSLKFNINTDAADATGDITINVQPIGEPLFSDTFSLANGQNFFRVDAINGETIDFVNFVSTVGVTVLFDDVRQVRIGGIPGVELPSVPEPATVALLGLGVTAFAIAARRKIRA